MNSALLAIANAGSPHYGPICVDDDEIDISVSAPCGTFTCKPGYFIVNYGENLCCCDEEPHDG